MLFSSTRLLLFYSIGKKEVAKKKKLVLKKRKKAKSSRLSTTEELSELDLNKSPATTDTDGIIASERAASPAGKFADTRKEAPSPPVSDINNGLGANNDDWLLLEDQGKCR